MWNAGPLHLISKPSLKILYPNWFSRSLKLSLECISSCMGLVVSIAKNVLPYYQTLSLVVLNQLCFELEESSVSCFFEESWHFDTLKIAVVAQRKFKSRTTVLTVICFLFLMRTGYAILLSVCWKLVDLVPVITTCLLISLTGWSRSRPSTSSSSY